MLSGDEPARGDGDRQPAAVDDVRRPAPLHRRSRPSLGRARDRPRVGHRRARRRRPAAVLDPDRRQHRRPVRSGYATAFIELLDQLDARGPRAVDDRVHVVERRHPRRAARRPGRGAGARAARVPDILAIGVAKGVDLGYPDIAELADETLALMGLDAIGRRPSDVEVDTGGSATTTPCRPRPATRRSAGRRATAAGCSTGPTPARASPACSARPPRAGSPTATDVVFIHTGGWPALFAPGGAPLASMP